MKKNILEKVCIFLLVLTLFSVSVYSVDCPENIAVEVLDYSPNVIPSGLLEEQSSVVNVWIAGLPTAPMEDTKITSVTAQLLDSSQRKFYSGGAVIRPVDGWTLANLGQMQITLKKTPSEKDVPERIEVPVKVTINYQGSDLSLGGSYDGKVILDQEINTPSGKIKILEITPSSLKYEQETYDSYGNLRYSNTTLRESANYYYLSDSSIYEDSNSATDRAYIQLKAITTKNERVTFNFYTVLDDNSCNYQDRVGGYCVDLNSMKSYTFKQGIVLVDKNPLFNIKDIDVKNSKINIHTDSLTSGKISPFTITGRAIEDITGYAVQTSQPYSLSLSSDQTYWIIKNYEGTPNNGEPKYSPSSLYIKKIPSSSPQADMKFCTPSTIYAIYSMTNSNNPSKEDTLQARFCSYNRITLISPGQISIPAALKQYLGDYGLNILLGNTANKVTTNTQKSSSSIYSIKQIVGKREWDIYQQVNSKSNKLNYYIQEVSIDTRKISSEEAKYWASYNVNLGSSSQGSGAIPLRYLLKERKTWSSQANEPILASRYYADPNSISWIWKDTSLQLTNQKLSNFLDDTEVKKVLEGTANSNFRYYLSKVDSNKQYTILDSNLNKKTDYFLKEESIKAGDAQISSDIPYSAQYQLYEKGIIGNTLGDRLVIQYKNKQILTNWLSTSTSFPEITKNLDVGSLIPSGFKKDSEEDVVAAVEEKKIDPLTGSEIIKKEVSQVPAGNNNDKSVDVSGLTTVTSLREGQAFKIGNQLIWFKKLDYDAEASIKIEYGEINKKSCSYTNISIGIDKRLISLSDEQIDKQIESWTKIKNSFDDAAEFTGSIAEYWGYACMGTTTFLLGKTVINAIWNPEEALLRDYKAQMRRAICDKFMESYKDASGGKEFKGGYLACTSLLQKKVDASGNSEFEKSLDSVAKKAIQSKMNTKYDEKLEEIKSELKPYQDNSENIKSDLSESDQGKVTALNNKITKIETSKADLNKDYNTFAESNAGEIAAFRQKNVINSEDYEGSAKKKNEDYNKIITDYANSLADSEGKKVANAANKAGEIPAGSAVYDITGLATSTAKQFNQKGMVEIDPVTERIKRVVLEDTKGEIVCNPKTKTKDTESKKASTLFIRHITYDAQGNCETIIDTDLDNKPIGKKLPTDPVYVSEVCLDTRYDISQSTWNKISASSLCSDIIAANRDYKTAGGGEAGQAVLKNGHNFEVIIGASKFQNEVDSLCMDVMETSDCKKLFMACDPVVCPPSRCDFGGTIKLDNVVGSGMVGSLFACYSRDKLPCITGVSNSFQDYSENVQAYLDCLNEQKVKHKSVGVCDRIRGIYTCEIFWNTVAPLGWEWVKNSLKNKFLEKVGFNYEKGAILTLSSFRDIKQFSSFLTSEYATQMLAGYKGKATADIGKEVCKQMLAGKAPTLGTLAAEFRNLQRPPTYTAFLQSSAYADDATRGEQDYYTVYYNIHAGTQYETLRYRIFLRTGVGTQIVLQDWPIASGTLERRDTLDENKDLVARSGYNQVCIQIANQEPDCGFGKMTSSSMMVNIINEKVVGSVSNVTSYKKCISDEQVQRKCSRGTPDTEGKTGIASNWISIGDCGELNGIYLGQCWMNKYTLQKSTYSCKNGYVEEDCACDTKHAKRGQFCCDYELYSLKGEIDPVTQEVIPEITQEVLERCTAHTPPELKYKEVVSESPEYINLESYKALGQEDRNMVNLINRYNLIIQKYYDKYKTSLSQYNIDVNTIKGVIAQESSGRPEINNNDAYGLMQVRAAAWQSAQTIDPQIGERLPDKDHAFNKEKNIQAGVAYLVWVATKSNIPQDNKNKQTILGGYNQGHANYGTPEAKDYATRVIKFENMFKGIDLEFKAGVSLTPMQDVTINSNLLTSNSGAGYTVFIDSGHGSLDSGARFYSTQEKNKGFYAESDINYWVSTKLSRVLQERGYTVKYITNPTKYDSKTPKVEVDTRIINLNKLIRDNSCSTTNKCVAIIIHSNNIDDRNDCDKSGMMAFTSGTGNELRKNNIILLDSYIIKSVSSNGVNLATSGLAPTQQPYTDTNLGLLESALVTIPVAYLEMGYMCNPSDRLRLIEDSGQEMYAKSIALGVANYFNSIKPVEVT